MDFWPILFRVSHLTKKKKKSHYKLKPYETASYFCQLSKLDIFQQIAVS